MSRSPTTTTSAVSQVSGSARSFATNSGPIPVGSPSRTPMRGFFRMSLQYSDHSFSGMRLLICILFSSFSSLCWADQPQPPKTNEPADTTPASQPAGQYLNLLGKTDTQGGEAKRNDNVSFDLVDNNALKEQNSR